MPDPTNIKIDLDQLEEMVDGLSKKYTTRVGILGSDVEKTDEESGLTNSEIGFKNEFGSITENIPARSFLRFPIEHKRKNIITFLNNKKASIQKKIFNGDMESLNTILGIVAEGVIQDAFATHGFGQWKANAPSTIAKKGSASPLIDTAELRKSISSEVKENG